MGTQLTPPKRGTAPPIFGRCLLWPNGWVDEDAPWYGSRPRPRPHCVRRRPSSPQRGTAASLFSAHVHCGHGRPSHLLLSSWFAKISRSLKKTIPYGKIFEILFRKDLPPQRSTCGAQISRNLANGKSVKSCVAYLTKKNKISPNSPAAATARIALKICQDQPQATYSDRSRFHPNRFTFGQLQSNA